MDNRSDLQQYTSLPVFSCRHGGTARNGIHDRQLTLTRGYLTILSGYIGWGLFPLYWALLLNHVPAGEVLLHRMLWSVPGITARNSGQSSSQPGVISCVPSRPTQVAFFVRNVNHPELGGLYLGGQS